MLINSGLSNKFWAETMGIVNYFCNRLPTKNKNHGKTIPEETWTK